MQQVKLKYLYIIIMLRFSLFTCKFVFSLILHFLCNKKLPQKMKLWLKLWKISLYMDKGLPLWVVFNIKTPKKKKMFSCYKEKEKERNVNIFL